MSEAVWPFTWCTVHFAGAVEGMAGCLVWRAKVDAVNELSEPDCVLVQRLLVDREAIDRLLALREIVSDAMQPASARVAAARVILDQRAEADRS